MGAKKASGKRKSGGKRDKRPGQGQGQGQGQRDGSSFAGASFDRSQVLGSGIQTTKINVQAYAAVPTALNSLPGLPQEFTGREDEIAKILSLLAPGNGTGAALGSVAGLPGVGKTTLAHAVGHAALDKGWFAGVQVVNLRGYDPNPVRPEDALEALLRALGVAAEHIPPTLDERAGLYRSQLDAQAREGQRVLILADNASTSDQVRPLLPARHHAVLVTSRHTLPGLGARLFNLHPLQPDAAVLLLRQRLEVADPDDRRVEDEPAGAEELTALCGYLPLALQIVAAILADDPDEPLSDRVRMLTNAGTRLGGLDDGERNLRAVFDECLTRLSHQEADLYRLIGLHTGPDISTPAVAALTGRPADKITPVLRQLVRARLLVQNGQARDRWSMHDLLRVHAQEQARTAMDRGRAPRRRYEQARVRLTGHYVSLARAADTHLQRPGEEVSPLFDGREQALAWFDAERENLLATTHAHARTRPAVHLGFSLGRYLEWRRRLQDRLTVRAHALEGCQALGDTLNLAGAWSNLGNAFSDLKRSTEALAAHRTALDLHRKSGDTDGQASAWNGVGNALSDLKRHVEAHAAHETALHFHQQTGNVHGQAGAWNGIGTALANLQRYAEAHAAHETARDLYQQTDDTKGEAGAWNNLGNTLVKLKRYAEAHAAHETALHLFQQTDVIHGQAGAWNNIGIALRDLERHTEAHAAHETARDLYQQTDDVHGQASAWNGIGTAFASLERHAEAHAAHETALHLFQQADDTVGEGIVWNNLGTACRDLERYAEAIAAGEKAVAMLTQEEDWARTGEAWAELATTLAVSGAEPPRVREAWEQSATAYVRAGDDEAAATSRAHAESPPTDT
ncbi:tetratricopeptide repeat protein [Streptomyces sp. N35]|uniref:tetratricopeptide repeat protein n=1 Tax=Streptomyces sp. N35 TaxID=2795730 RepID=UPI0018F64AFA|nr:tetratricopeptide repeat protein [Streptomyces sp. N35]